MGLELLLLDEAGNRPVRVGIAAIVGVELDLAIVAVEVHVRHVLPLAVVWNHKTPFFVRVIETDPGKTKASIYCISMRDLIVSKERHGVLVNAPHSFLGSSAQETLAVFAITRDFGDFDLYKPKFISLISKCQYSKK